MSRGVLLLMLEHGTYSVVLEGRLLSISLEGTFNDIATRSVCKKIKAKVESLNGQGFAILLDCIAYEGSTPDAHKISNQHLLWLNKQNCIARAVIYNKKLYFDMVKNEQPALFELQNRREFHDVKSAQSWLLSQL
jgi:hypothetical protein